MAPTELLELINKNYTWDADGYEIVSEVLPTPAIIPEKMAPEAKADEKKSESEEKKDAPDTVQKMTKEEAEEIKKGEKEYKEALAFLKDAIAPSMMRVDTTKLQIWDTYIRTVFVYAYPDFLEWNWLSPLINWDIKFDMSMFVYPVDSAFIMKYLRKRLTELRSQQSINADKWLIWDPALDAQMQDVEELRASLTRWQEKYFHLWIYVTLYAETEEELKKTGNALESLLSWRNILTKQAFLRSEQGFIWTGPFAKDEVAVYRNISTKWLSTTFPFTSNTLSQDDWILYGINTHNNSLIIFDRFKTENANMTVFAKSWGWKSFAVKLEVLRSLMMWVDVIVIDPENEYKSLVDTVWWSYLNINLNSSERINPFDLPRAMKDTEAKPWDLLRWAIVDLLWLMSLMLWKLTPSESSILEKATIITYSLKWLTFEDDDIENKEIPVMKDLYSVLETMDWAKWITERLEKYVYWIFAWIFSETTNINLQEWLVVFSVRDLDESLRPVAMYIVLKYIWNTVRSSNKKRILVVDEAWNIMQYEDSARFVFWLVKRARKYNLWVTTITQDVEDFVTSQYGKAIVTNSSIQLLLKQSPASIDVLQNVFKLTEQEKYILLQASVWQGLFFAWTEHVWIHVLASYFEEKVISTNPNK
ncbi:MAG: Type IV secretory pathway VirB4 component-like protein [uncultured bacterium (gcode 4)]|uniref:Type IV secretory pathway VirB4 component-like protein n=1 Tax=uncultured bacterium (gcode 4) TaxID=1234023 RepID=K2FE77_9BACT|nr:MAG: Type IV secretory pathway VirB4 component-like protein [uncultured bacterium (gcode 4)]